MEYLMSDRFLHLTIIVYIIIPLLALAVIFLRWLVGKEMKPETVRNLSEVGKWYIVSVAMVLIGNIIDSGYKEREMGISEMKIFDSHVATITQADNIVARWKLASYYAIVTPTERLRVRWEEYRESIREEYEQYIELQEQAIELETKPVMTPKEQTELKRINMKIDQLDRQLVPDRVEFMKVDTLRTGTWQRRGNG